MYKVIKSAVLGDKPHVVKAPDPLFIISQPQDDSAPEKNKLFSDTADADAGQNAAEAALHNKAALENEIKKLENDINSKQTELKILHEKADLIMKKAEEKKQLLLAEAEKNSAEKIEAAAGKVDEIILGAKEEGHEQGYNEGLEQSKSEQAEIIKKANEKAMRIADNAEEQIRLCFENTENDLVDLVMTVAAKIISQQFADMPQLILPVVQNALDKVKNQTSIEVRVSENAYEFAMAAKSELQNMLSGNVRLDIKSDDSLSDGDCWIETPDGSVDARLLSQINEIKKSLKEVVGKYETDDRQV